MGKDEIITLGPSLMGTHTQRMEMAYADLTPMIGPCYWCCWDLQLPHAMGRWSALSSIFRAAGCQHTHAQQAVGQHKFPPSSYHTGQLCLAVGLGATAPHCTLWLDPATTISNQEDMNGSRRSMMREQLGHQSTHPSKASIPRCIIINFVSISIRVGSMQLTTMHQR